MEQERRTSNAVSEDDGFTLIELLIVVVIIGILAAIAVPQFTGAKEKAVVAKMKSDLHNIATAQEVYYSDNNSYASVMDSLDGINLSDGVSLAGAMTASDSSWSAVLQAEGTSQTCGLEIGTGGSNAGVVTCN